MSTKLALVGDSGYKPIQKMRDYISALPNDTEILSCHTSAIDRKIVSWARTRHYKVTTFEADYQRDGEAAGTIRNAKIIAACDSMTVFWHKGSWYAGDLAFQAKQAGKVVVIIK